MTMLRGGMLGLGMVLVAAGAAVAADMPREGSFRIHSAYYFTGTITPVGKDRMYFDGPYWGVSFNDAGGGFLHLAAWNCPGLSNAVDGSQTTVGHCSIKDGDRGMIYGDWTGGGKLGGEFKGHLDFTAGAGGYTGITGALDFSCFAVSDDGRQLQCRQAGSYKLPAMQ